VKRNAKIVTAQFLRLSYLYEADHGLYAEEEFHRLVELESKRAARSKTVSLLVLLDLTPFEGRQEGDRVLRDVVSALFSSTREIDTKGWYRCPNVLGVVMTDLMPTNDSLRAARDALVDRLRTNLAKSLDRSELERILFPGHRAEPLHNFLRARG